MSHTHPNNRGLIGACNPTVLTFVLDSRFSGDLPAGMPSPQLQERENVGRCDHAWASYFHANRSTLASRIFCLKDSYQAHTMFPPVLARDLVEGSHDGFACAYRMLDLRHRHPKAWEPTLCDVSDMGRWQLATYDKPHDQNRNRNRNQNQNRTQTQGPSPSPRHENRTDGFAAYNGVSIVLASFASFWPLASLASTNAGCYRAGSHGFIIILFSVRHTARHFVLIGVLAALLLCPNLGHLQDPASAVRSQLRHDFGTISCASRSSMPPNTRHVT